MRVKRLEIQGFKSFKDKTVVHFDHSITGIVGPNGCGKSNIVDAFFWVMGEQSYKHIRGSGSDDLIFNGSSEYNAAAIAEATLVLEQDVIDSANAPAGATAADVSLPTKKKEISVTRRLYRGGEGEYFINGVQARLRDIQELFMDTGVGAKGYSVIEQGQIGKIVNAKPEDRRLLIEEAAGIAKYKARKKESLRKLEAAEGNLSRLNDVLQEIERGVGSLDRQAQKARKYNEYKGELQSREMHWGRRKMAVLEQKKVRMVRERSDLEQLIAGIRTELTTIETDVETDRIHQLTLSKTTEELQTKIANLSSELSAEQSAMELAKRRREDLNSQIISLESERAELDASIQLERSKIDTRAQELEGTEAECVEASTLVERLEAEVVSIRSEVDTLRTEVTRAREELVRGISKSTDLMSKDAALTERLESLTEQLQSAEGRAAELKERLSQAQTQMESVVVEIEKTTELKTQARERVQIRQAKLEELRSWEKSLSADREKAQKNLSALTGKLQTLQELEAAREELGTGTRTLIEWAEQAGKSEGYRVIADVLHVNPGYELAVAAALEGWIDSLVAINPELALESIRKLSTEKKGRAAIQLLIGTARTTATLGAERSLEDLQGQLGLFGLTGISPLKSQLEIQNLDQAQAQILAGRLSQVVVVDSLEGLALDQMVRVLSEIGVTLVDRNGLVLDSMGVLRGGTLDADSGRILLDRKREIAELSKTVETATAEAESLDTKLAEVRTEAQSNQTQLESEKAEAQDLEIQAARLDRDAEVERRGVQQLHSEESRLNADLQKLVTTQASALDQRAAISDELAGLMGRRQELETRLATQEAVLTDKASVLQARDSELQGRKVGAASLFERTQSVKRELESAQSFVASRQNRMNDLERMLERLTTELSTHGTDDSAFEQRILELTEAIGNLRQTLAQERDLFEQLRAKESDLHERAKQLQREGEDRQQKLNQVVIESEKVSSDTAHLLQNLEEKYGQGCLENAQLAPIQTEMGDTVVTSEITEEEERQLFAEVEELREKIRRLGEVNPMAVVEYEELKARLDHLTHEKMDLLQSIDNLKAAIEHINITSEDRFKKAFEAIADRFEKLFPIIFGGGRAQLSLTYPEGSTDILDAGVDILAQPPGKKIVNIGLLSGGEKALTAVSLIFAIFMVKPSPFCILDEVDAPLDDANIGKFNALLKEMSSNTQFILITHNKKTMELNDTLYGVTMEEPGVSKMVSIEMQ